MQTKIIAFARFIASQRGKCYLYSECDTLGIYRSDAYAAATFRLAFYGFRRNLQMLNKFVCRGGALLRPEQELADFGLFATVLFSFVGAGLCSARLNTCERLAFLQYSLLAP